MRSCCSRAYLEGHRRLREVGQSWLISGQAPSASGGHEGTARSLAALAKDAHVTPARPIRRGIASRCGTQRSSALRPAVQAGWFLEAAGRQ